MLKSLITKIGVAGCILCSGCIRDDLSNCPPSVFRAKLYVKLDVQAKAAATRPYPVREGLLFIFDKDGRLVKQQRIAGNTIQQQQPIELEYPTRDSITVVIWGNQDDTRETFSIPDEPALAACRLLLTRNGEYVNFPSDLFHGITRLACDEPDEERIQTVTLCRSVGSVAITCYDMDQGLGESDIRFRLKHTPEGLDFHGKSGGEAVDYRFDPRPEILHGKKAWYSGIRNLLPCSIKQQMTLDILRDGKVIHSEPLPAKAAANQTMNIVIYIATMSLSVHVVVKPWGEVINQTIIW